MAERSTSEKNLENLQNAEASTSASSPAPEALMETQHTQESNPKQTMVTPSSDAVCMTSYKPDLTISSLSDHPPTSEDDRLKTFEKWSTPLFSPKTLARNGFYYFGVESDIRCAFCKLELRCVVGDDPVKAHWQWAPQCRFLQSLTAIDESLRNPPPKDYGRDECGPYSDTSSADCVPGPAHPMYASEAVRLRSFKHWPRCMRQKPEDLAEAGFFYTGTGDRTKCFYCNGGLSDWEPDDIPWKEHTRLFNRCPYVDLVKGREYVQKVITEACAIPAEGDTSVSITSVETDVNEERGATTAEGSNLCKICYVEERNVCFVPCGHVVCCAKCSVHLAHHTATKKCPMCRRVFCNTVRLYYS